MSCWTWDKSINLGEETFSITRINKINQSSQLQGQPDDLFWYKTWHWNVSVILEDLFVELEFVLTFENPNFPVFETCFWNLRPPNWFEPPFCLVIQLKTRKQRKLRPKQSGYGFQKKWHSFRHFPKISTNKFLDKMALIILQSKDCTKCPAEHHSSQPVIKMQSLLHLQGDSCWCQSLSWSRCGPFTLHSKR